MLLAFDFTGFNGGNIVTVAILIGAIALAWKTYRSDAIETWRQLAEGRAEELKVREQELVERDERIRQLQQRVHDLEVKVAQLEALPDTERVYELVRDTGRHFDEMLNSTITAQTKAVQSLEKVEGTLVDMSKAIAILVDRDRPTPPPA